MSGTREPHLARRLYGDFAPKMAELTDDVLFGDVWARPELSRRDRSLITCAMLIAQGRTEQMAYHFTMAGENGVTDDELIEVITHLAFYAGWPCANSAMNRLRDLVAARD
jgi:4-carboxymuconolactone decarboxylase